MAKYRLKDYRTVKVTTINYSNPEGNVKVNINRNIPAIEVGDTETSLIMSFELMQESDVEEKKFYVYVEIAGKYEVEFNSKEELDDLGMQLSNDLFPYLRSSVSTIMASAGMPPFFIPISVLDPDNNE